MPNIALALACCLPIAALTDPPVRLTVLPGGAGGVGAFPVPSPAVDCVPAAVHAEFFARTAALRAASGAGALAQLAAPPLLPFDPLGGNVYEDVFPGIFVDLDPSSGIRDFACGELTYNTHAGHDIGLRSFTEQALGVPVFAVADGTVLFAQDGFPDMNTAPGADDGNYLIIDHGGRNGWYFHLKQNSVAFGVGQAVKQGDQLGLAASSGYSYGPHLHFGLDAGGVTQEPHAGPCGAVTSGWARQDPLLLEPRVLEFGVTLTDLFTQGPPAQFEQPKHNQIPLNAGFTFYWMHLANVPAGAQARVRFYRPDGALSQDTGNFDFPYTGSPFIRWWPGFIYFWQFEMQSVPGTWRYVLDINGVQVIDAPVLVVATVDPGFNRSPEPISAAFEPAVPTPAAALACRVGASIALDDLDWDIVRYRYVWKVGGATVRDVVSAGRRDMLPRASFAIGQSVSCTVTPNDGKVDGTPVTVAATAAADPWLALVGGKYGAAGVPWLLGGGPLTPGSPGSLAFGQARPGASALLFIGPAPTPAPFKGGTFVPNPVLQSVVLPTGAAGTLALPFTWPAGVPSGVQVSLQLWVPDAAGLLGSSSSNGVVLTTP